MKIAAYLIAVLFGLSVAGPGRAVENATVFGLWLKADQGWVVETSPCGAKLCGKLVGFRQTRSASYIATDRQNPDPAKRDRSLCGLAVIGDFARSTKADGEWNNGWVYDTDTGKSYSGEIQLSDPNKIELRGYVLDPLFGHTLTLVRQTQPFTRCLLPTAKKPGKTPVAAKRETNMDKAR